MKNFFGLAALAFGLSACAVAPKVDPEIQGIANEPLYCQGADECARYWKRAQIWVTNHSRWKIQTVTDAIIVTYTPPQGEPSRGYRITREPLRNDREQIKIASGCSNMFGCDTDELKMAADFKTYVKQ